MDKKKNLVNGNKINEEIKVPEVRLIGADGQPVGILPTRQALEMAKESNLDLVLISDVSIPPVCKILNYGKYKYALQKQKIKNRKKQKTVEIKEIQFRPFIGENDLNIKCRAIQKFVADGNKVKIIMRFRGREMNRTETGFNVISKVLSLCEDFAKADIKPKLEGSVIATVLSKKL